MEIKRNDMADTCWYWYNQTVERQSDEKKLVVLFSFAGFGKDEIFRVA